MGLLVVFLPAVALAANDSPPPSGRIAVVAPSSPAASAPAPAAKTLPKLSVANEEPAADPADCRMGCAQSLYFCRAGDHPDGCADGWSQCVAACNSPALTPDDSAAP